MPFFSSFTGSFAGGRRTVAGGGGGGGGAATYTVSGATQSGSGTNITSGNNPRFFVYNNDGTKVFTCEGNRIISELNLSTAYDVSTTVWSYTVQSGDLDNITAASIDGAAFSPDGTTVIVCHQTSSPDLQQITQYDLTSAFDLSTISNSVATLDVVGDIPGSLASVGTVVFNDDGSKLFVGESVNDLILEYSLSSAYDISTATYTTSFDYGNATGSSWIIEMIFNSTGTKLLVADSVNDKIWEIDLSTGFDLSTATYNSNNIDFSSIDGTPAGLAYNDDESKLYVAGGQNSKIYTFDLVQVGGGGAISSLAFVRSGASGATNPWQLKMSSDGTIATWAISGIGAGSDQYTLSTAWDFSTATKTVSNSTKIIPSGHDANYTSNQMAFSNDGNSLYVNAGASGGTTRSIYQYNMSTPWTLSTASYASKSFIFTPGTIIGDLIFNNDGSKMYIPRRTSGTEFYQYSLSSAYDITTATDDSITFDPGVDLNGLAFNADGTYLYAIYDPSDTNYIKQWSLSTPYDLSTATAGTDVLLGDATTEAAPTGLAFGNDQLHVSGQQFDNVRTYDIS